MGELGLFSAAQACQIIAQILDEEEQMRRRQQSTILSWWWFWLIMSSTPSQLYYSIQISMGLISSLASFLIILSVCFSKARLGTPYRRIIFFISIPDLLLSLGLATGP